LIAAAADTLLAILLLFAIPILGANLFGGLNPEYSSPVRAVVGTVVVAAFVRLAIRWANRHFDPRSANRPSDPP
jgi:hypothetical protein